MAGVDQIAAEALADRRGVNAANKRGLADHWSGGSHDSEIAKIRIGIQGVCLPPHAGIPG